MWAVAASAGFHRGCRGRGGHQAPSGGRHCYQRGDRPPELRAGHRSTQGVRGGGLESIIATVLTQAFFDLFSQGV